MGKNDYSNFGFDKSLRSRTSLSSKKIQQITDRQRFVTALDQDIHQEKSVFINNIVTKGTFQANLGGVLELKDTTGGTTIFTANPTTGEVTVAGPVQANVTLNVGSMSNSAITGTSNLTGTLTSTGIVAGGTFNNSVLGTPRIVGGTYNTAKFETPSFDTSAGSTSLAADGQVAIKTHIGTGVWTYRIGGTTYYITPSGTLLPN